MRAVLGIDAAWTLRQPSGVALIAEAPTGWRLVSSASSYQRFLALGDKDLVPELRPAGSPPDVGAILKSASAQCGQPVDLIAIDMPLAHHEIVSRRESDNAVSRAYGARGCGTHTPSASRPGRISDELKASFAEAGYRLQTDNLATPGLIEVYPHPALVELAAAPWRLPYKARKIRSYWPTLTPPQRRERLYQQWREIVFLLDREIAGVEAALARLDAAANGLALKAYEDALDAIVCAWVGVCALEGRATPLGNELSAIWVPLPNERATNALERS